MESKPEENQTAATVEPTSTQSTTEKQELKTIAVRVEEGLHAQLQFIAQLTGNSLTDEVRAGIEQRIASAQEDPAIIAKAQEARERIERQAALRSAAIAGFIGLTATEEQAPSTTKVRRSPRSDKGSA
ncbi:hypothetical protein [Nocardioides marmoraquaticus]